MRKELGSAILTTALVLTGSATAEASTTRTVSCGKHVRTIPVEQGHTLIVNAREVLVNGDGHLNGKQLFDNDENTGSVGVRINGKVRTNEAYADYPLSVTVEPCKIKGDAIDAAIGAAMRAMSNQHADNPDYSVKVVFAPVLQK